MPTSLSLFHKNYQHQILAINIVPRPGSENEITISKIGCNFFLRDAFEKWKKVPETRDCLLQYGPNESMITENLIFSVDVHFPLIGSWGGNIHMSLDKY